MSNSRPAAFAGGGSDDNRPDEMILSLLTGCHTATGTVTPGPKSSDKARYATSDISSEGVVVLVNGGTGSNFDAGCEAENASAGCELPMMASEENAAEARKFFRGIVLVVLCLLSAKCNDVRVLCAEAESERYAKVSSQRRDRNNADIKVNERSLRVGW